MAEQAGSPEPTVRTGRAEHGEHLPDAEEASSWVGSRVDELEGTAVGRIESLLVDAEDGSPTWFVIRRGRRGRRSAIPVEFVAPGVGHVWTPFSRETILDAPEVTRDGGLGRELERELAVHFGMLGVPTEPDPSAAGTDEDPGSVPSV